MVPTVKLINYIGVINITYAIMSFLNNRFIKF